MAWLLGLVIVGGLVYLAYSTPEARKAIVIVLALVVGGVAFLLYREYSIDRKAVSRIAMDEVELRGFVTAPRTGVLYTKGSVKNLSKLHTLESLDMRVRAHDCPTTELSEACETVGESTEHIKLEVPPGQVRGAEKSVNISSLPAVRTLVWSYDVIAVRAKVE